MPCIFTVSRIFFNPFKVKRIKFWFYRQTDKSDSTLCVKLTGKIFQILIFTWLFYETMLRIGHFGVLVYFSTLFSVTFLPVKVVHPVIFICIFELFRTFLLNFITCRSFWCVQFIFSIIRMVTCYSFWFLFIFKN